MAILDYITQASGSIAVAKRFVARLRARCHELASYETIVGRPRPEIGSDVRSTSVGNYLIYFRYRDDRFEVLKITEGHRDIRSSLGDMPK